MYENGFAEKLDMDKQEVQLANLNSSRTTVINQIDNGYLGLKVLMGMPLTDSLVLTDNLSDDMIREGILKPPILITINEKIINLPSWA